jgi:rhodanese-related sulfurtransferase
MEKQNLEEIIKTGAIIIDVRTKKEFNRGHIEGSINIPLDQLGDAMSWLQKDIPIIVICASGQRSQAAKGLLDANGYQKVYNGGAWDSLGNIKAGGCPITF